MTTDASASTRPTASATAATRRSARRFVGLRPTVCERGNLGAHARERVVIAVRDDHAVAVGRLRDDGAPWVDHHRAPIGGEARGQLPVLVGGSDEALVLDRARA